MKGVPDERLVASITVHRPSRMSKVGKWRVGWWLMRQAWWLVCHDASDFASGRMTFRMVGIPAPAKAKLEVVPPIVRDCGGGE